MFSPRLPIHNSASVTTDRDWGPSFLIVCSAKEVVFGITKRSNFNPS